MIEKRYLLTDTEVAHFLVQGYHTVESTLPLSVHENIACQLDALPENPGDAILESVPELRQVLDCPAVTGVCHSLMGSDYELKSHRHWHCKQPGDGFMQWHQDSINQRDTRIDRFLALYYPRTVTADMGPTVIVPGTQYRNAPTDRMATYSNFRGQVPLVVPAGTVAVTHHDLWHGTAANRSSARRHMIKFLFRRTRSNTEPTWNHDSESVDSQINWGRTDQMESVAHILSFGNPLGVGGTDQYKERVIRRRCWEQLLGEDE
jgi:hypothetical protein